MDSKYSVGSSNQTVVKGFSNFLAKRHNHQKNHNSPKKIKLSNPAADSSTTAASPSNNVANNSVSNISAILEHRRQLPVYNIRLRLIDKIKEIQTLIIIGETGSGKTTQIPQFLHEAGFTEKGLIGVTQPRRVAAITVATRVAKEKNCRIGELVGYSVRFEDNSSHSTKIKFLTDGTLLREALGDRLLKKYRVIILDEAHERTINTDILFGIVKEAQRIRSEKKLLPLKLIIMSATMDVDHFRNYFNKADVLFLEGRTHNVRLFCTIAPQNDYLEACMITLFVIHKKAPVNHDVLMFLTGQEEIELIASKIRNIVKTMKEGPAMRVCTLYAAMPPQKQLEVFQPIAPNSRKVIISTNIAETSLTISGIKFVIDCGMVKAKYHQPTTGMDVLKIERISQAQALQRCGRAGRESDGVCYRTYTLSDFKAMPVSAVPEILRCNIAAVMLQLLGMDIDCRKFDFMDMPSSDAIESALKELKQLGAIKETTGVDITELGRKMAKFPLDPKYSKLILSAPEFGCLDEMLCLVALLSGENIFQSSIDKREEMMTAHAKFCSEFGDHLTLLNVFRTFEKTDKFKMWCSQNYLNCRNLQYARDVRDQLKGICTNLGISSSSCDNNFDQVRKCLISGLFTNIAELQRDNNYVALNNRQRAKIHPSSVFSGKALPNYIIFTEFVITQKSFLRTVTAIEPEWIGEIMPTCGALEKMNLTRNKFSLGHANNNNNFEQGASGGSKLVNKTLAKFAHL